MAEATASRRRRHRRKKSGLPNDIILYHIAPKLSAKSVIRLMTVSKEFHSFLNTRKFTKTHLHHVTNNPDQKYDKFLVLSTTNPLFTTIDCESPDQDLTLPSRPIPFLARCPPYPRILTSFHGLVCVGISQRRDPRDQWWYDYLILWNPVTGDYKFLSRTNYDFRSRYNTFQAFGLYYSTCDDDYKLVHITSSNGAYIYSLKSDSWKKLVDFTSATTHTTSVWLNESLYFIETYPFLSMLRFDTKSEKFTKITTPSNLSPLVNHDVRHIYPIVHRGCIYLCVRYYGRRKLIVMKNEPDGVWTKVDTCEIVPTFECDSKWLLHWMRNGNWLMICTSKTGRSYLYKFNRKKKAYTYLGMFTGGVAIPEGRYTETLVSPNRYMNKR